MSTRTTRTAPQTPVLNASEGKPMTTLVHRIAGEYRDETDDQDYLLGTEWWFDSTDPAAVLLRCRQPRGEIVEWTFGRSLVAHGLHAAAGLALLRVEPCACGQHVTVTAYFADVPILVRFPLVEIEKFLVETTRLVALGEVAEEATYIDGLPAEYAELMGEWPR